MSATSKRQIIRLNGLEFFAYHGLTEQERQNGGHYELDCEYETFRPVEIDTEMTENIIDYELIYDKIAEIMISRRYNLIEALAEKIVDTLFEMFNLKSVKINVRKKNPPISGKADSFEVIAERIA